MLKVDIINETTGSGYVIAETDTLIMTVKRDVADTDPIIQKRLVGTDTFHIEPKDTSMLEFGKYVYDVELNTKDGEVYTIIEPTTFEISQEVTCDV